MYLYIYIQRNIYIYIYIYIYTREEGSKARGAAPLDDSLFVLQDPEHGERDLLLRHQHHLQNDFDYAKRETYHNADPIFRCLNNAAVHPNDGDGSEKRIGEEINQKGFKMRCQLSV